ncbi:MAG: ATP-binding protein [Patescibacteria group bacterium]
MFIFTYTAFFLAAACLGFAVFIFSRRHDSRDQAVQLTISSVAVALWVGANAMADLATSRFQLLLWSGLAVIGVALFISSYAAFVYVFVSGRALDWFRWLAYFSPTVLVATLAFSRYSVTGMAFPAGRPTEIQLGPLYIFMAFFLFVILIYCALKLLKFRRSANTKQRLQIAYVNAGIMLVLIGATIFNLALPMYGEVRLYNLGPQFSIFLIIFSGYAIQKYRLLDIKVLLQRGLVYSILLFFALSAYLLALALTQIIFERYSGVSYLIASLLTTFFGILGAPTLKRLLERLTDHIFFRSRCSYEEAINRLSEVLNHNFDLDELVIKTSHELEEIFRVDWVKFIVFADDIVEDMPTNSKTVAAELVCDCVEKVPRIMRCQAERICDRYCRQNQLTGLTTISREAVMLVPVAHENRLVAMICFGSKRSGETFHPHDESILEVFAKQCAVAMVKATLYSKEKNQTGYLAEEVANRTAELEHSYEERANMMLDIAHNLQTPLTILKSQIEDSRLKTGNNETFTKLEISIDKISQFTRRLLKLASLTSDQRLASRRERVNLSDLLTGIISYFEVLANEQGISLKTDIAPNIQVQGHHEQLEELVLNILSNATKFIANERIISVSLQSVDLTAQLSIKDTGRGIPAEDFDKLFSRFFRSTASKECGGTGLGLAICKRIVELHDGDISIESQPGEGTSVTVTLPLSQTFTA